MTIARTTRRRPSGARWESGLVAHRKSLACTGRDLSKQVVANLVGSPDLILEKIDGLQKIGVDHACALVIPADSMAEFERPHGGMVREGGVVVTPERAKALHRRRRVSRTRKAPRLRSE